MVLNDRNNQRLEVAQIKFLRSLLVFTKSDHQWNVYIRENLQVQNTLEDIRGLQENLKRKVKKECRKCVYQLNHCIINPLGKEEVVVQEGDGKTRSWMTVHDTGYYISLKFN